ncbi:hypothetical protein V1264_000568 [Littorina saxatilis]|uniref:Uncharacterized protein n=1 Tax=Littorina saxatilis TaxID=31220 RepID=A0AAN9GN70_9CAEN
MCDLSKISIQKVQLWSTEALKAFLCVRKKSVEGAHEELVARAFAALEDGIPVDHEAENAERVLLQEYKQKLCVEGVLYPDPFTITTGLKGSKMGDSCGQASSSLTSVNT